MICMIPKKLGTTWDNPGARQYGYKHTACPVPHAPLLITRYTLVHIMLREVVHSKTLKAYSVRVSAFSRSSSYWYPGS